MVFPLSNLFGKRYNSILSSYTHKKISTGVWGMICGDGDQNGQVDNSDKNEVWMEELGFSGYYFGDFNRDGVVDIIDKNDFWKFNVGSGAKID